MNTSTINKVSKNSSKEFETRHLSETPEYDLPMLSAYLLQTSTSIIYRSLTDSGIDHLASIGPLSQRA